MSDEIMLAILYDFYNENTLRDQNLDINYYLNHIKLYDSKNILVVGAGTGRVAIPLSKIAKVDALDFNNERLKILAQKEPNIDLIHTDFLEFNASKEYDLIIVPYSTLQFDNNIEKLNNFFKKLHAIMNEKTIVIFDVSENFNYKPPKDNELLFKKYSDILHDYVEVYYSAKRFEEYIEFFINYKLCNNNTTLLENERYYYYNKELLANLINDNDLKILKIDDGYAEGKLENKHLYHCRRRK